MLSSLAASRKLVLLGVCVFIAAFVFLHGTTSFLLPDRIASSWTGDAKNRQKPGQSGRPNKTKSKGSGGNGGGGQPVGGDSQDDGPRVILHESYDEQQTRLKELRKDWSPPAVANHWPPYSWYADQDYDPNRWEGFEWENDYYTSNGIQRLKGGEATLKPYLPYPAYNSPEWRRDWRGEYQACEGARGKLLNESFDDIVHAHVGLPPDFPQYSVGSADVTGIDTEHCFDRFNRYGPYGYRQHVKEQIEQWQRPSIKPDWELVQWNVLQEQCYSANKNRYRASNRSSQAGRPGKEMPHEAGILPYQNESQSHGPQYHPRTAVLIRAWTGYEYTDNDIHALRAIITELSLLSGGEYQVFLLVNVKNNHIDFWNDKFVYQEILRDNVPPEFHGISLLWNERLLEEWYPMIGDWQVYWHQFMPLQWFSKSFPEFDFVWNWETDARYTGNHYHFLEQMSDFTKSTPRKHMWERNARFYFPEAHGTYDEFLNDTDATIMSAVGTGKMKPVWGPRPYKPIMQSPIGPTPPHDYEEDNFSWGVGEDADLITLQPIWDPTHTWWTYRDKIFNYIPGVRPHFKHGDPLAKDFHHAEFVHIPRRTFINTVARFSRRLIHAMHVENRAGRTMQAEMWPATVALQHGLKAVYAPHPIWMDRKWPAWYMDAVFNADGNNAARWGARGDSVYNQDREHNFGGWSWYFNSQFPRTLYRRWLGWSSTVGSEEQYPNNPLRTLGGRPYEKDGFTLDIPADAPEGGSSFGGREINVGGAGRMCLPGMLLHPVKHVYRAAEAPEPETDDDGGYEGLTDWVRKLFD